MKKIVPTIAISFLLIFTLSSCETDNNALLTDGIWDFSNLTTDSEDETLQSWILLGKAFMTDATLEFQEGGTYILNSPLSEEPTTGEWSLIGEDQLILESDELSPSTSNIETLTKDRLVYIETFVDTTMNAYSVTTTWTRD